MSRSEKAIMTVLCLITKENKLLLQDRTNDDWHGLTLPGAHVEKEESFYKAIVREVKEETGLTIKNPKLCGVKQFQTDNDERYVVLLYKTNEFTGTLTSSEEGEMLWIDRADLESYQLVDNFYELIEVMESDNLTEFMYKRKNKGLDWLVKIY